MTVCSLRPALCAAALFVAGCASTVPQFYSLAETGSVAATGSAPSGSSSLFIEMAPVAMPERFMRPQMVVRQKDADGAQVDILEQHRWSSSFEDELRDALGSGVAQRLGAVDATKVGRPPGAKVLRIGVQMRQLDAIEGTRVDAAFSWTLRQLDEDRLTACRAAISEPVASGTDALAAGVRRVTARLADSIAKSVSGGGCVG
ncbi:MAG: PqiC family protein [Gammaproteobacteria bacterium]|nr:PqiC family protein [Gammaproteobacteria bacterium]MBU1444319.1 PqiC family protein [Gammaproteobacteria bacterium]MBU2287054.1 PqiC family protein [Gammaproteobacteria bacterium]